LAKKKQRLEHNNLTQNKSTKLPTGWISTTLGDLTIVSHKRASPADLPLMRYVGLEHIESQSMRLLRHGYAGEIRSSSLQFYAGDVLYGKMRPYLNKVWVADFDGLCSTEFLVFRKIEGLNGEFLALRLNSDDFVAFANSQVSGERPRVDFQKISSFPLLLPPFAEQARIVAKVSRALERIYRAEVATERAQMRLKKYRAAVLDAAATGRLTEAWRAKSKGTTRDDSGNVLLDTLKSARRTHWKETELKRRDIPSRRNESWERSYHEPAGPDTAELPPIPLSWAWARLLQLGFITGGLTKNPSRKSLRLKLPYLRVANVYANELRLGDVIKIGVKKVELEKLLLQKGDLLIVEGNGSKDQIGRVAIWDGSIEQCVHQNHIIKVRLVDRALGKWLLSWFLSPTGRQHIEKVASSTTGLYTLSISKVSDLPVPLPPSAEQDEINLQIETRLSGADRLSAMLIQQSARAKQAKKALMLEAFEGRLVPQSQTDEPASALLQRIQANIEIENQKLKAKPMVRAKSKPIAHRRPLLEILREHMKPMTPKQLFIASGYQQEFESNEYRQEVVDAFYEELRHLVGPNGSVEERRPSRNRVLLGIKS
jgi:type I restriction enzyme, S subunit